MIFVMNMLTEKQMAFVKMWIAGWRLVILNNVAIKEAVWLGS